MSKKLDAAIDALVDALAELPEHELEGWQRGNRLGLRILCELGRHRAGDGTGSPQVGLSRPPGSARLAPALLHVSQARAARSPSLRWLVLPPAAFAALLGPRERKKGANSRTPAVFNHPRVLPQGQCRFGPTLAGSMVGRHRDLEILDASHVLDDALAVVGPPVDAEREVIPCHRRALSRLGFGSTFSTSFGSTSKTELLTEASALGGPPPG